MWEVYGIDLRNPHLFSPSPSPSSPSSSSSPSLPNSTIIQTGLDIFFTVTFVNKKSGIRQIGAACNSGSNEKASELVCQHFGYKSGQWIEEPKNTTYDYGYDLKSNQEYNIIQPSVPKAIDF